MDTLPTEQDRLETRSLLLAAAYLARAQGDIDAFDGIMKDVFPSVTDVDDEGISKIQSRCIIDMTIRLQSRLAEILEDYLSVID